MDTYEWISISRQTVTIVQIVLKYSFAQYELGVRYSRIMIKLATLGTTDVIRVELLCVKCKVMDCTGGRLHVGRI